MNRHKLCARVVRTPLLLAALLPLLGLGLSSEAATISFNQITTNGAQSPAAQLTAEVSDEAGQVLFKFVNASGVGSIASRISEVYWDDGLSLLSNGPVVDAGNTSAGVSLTGIPANPSDLPSGGNVGFAADFSAGRVQGAANGVDPGEMAAFLFDGDTIAVIAALATGDLRLGMHVISIQGDGQSETFVNEVPMSDPGVPEPTAALLALLAIGLGGARRPVRCPRTA